MCVSLQRNIALGDRMKRVCEQKDEATTDLLSSSTTESTENPTVHILKVFLRDGYLKKKDLMQSKVETRKRRGSG